MLPARVHDPPERELEGDLRRLRPVLCVGKDGGAGRRVLHERGRARDVELVAARLGLGKGLERIAAVALEIPTLRAPMQASPRTKSNRNLSLHSPWSVRATA